jgi:hypothetical protein
MAETGLRVTARRRFGQFLITKPANVEIDGVAVGVARWGKPTFFPTAAGPHRVTLFFRYLGRQRTGEATVDLEVVPEQSVDVLYRSPWIVTNKGSLTVRSAPAAQSG